MRVGFLGFKSVAPVLDYFSAASNPDLKNRIFGGLALCEGMLLGLLAHALCPPSRLLLIAVLILAIVFAFAVLFWLVCLLRRPNKGGPASGTRAWHKKPYLTAGNIDYGIIGEGRIS